MTTRDLISAAGLVTERVVRALPPSGEIIVDLDGDFRCDLLHAGREAPLLAVGDVVLVWVAPSGHRGVVLGRVGPTAHPTQTPEPGTPAEVVIAATKRLVLRCGDGEIVLRGDGKVLIRGQDLVSKAIGTNRIKGGQVVVN